MTRMSITGASRLRTPRAPHAPRPAAALAILAACGVAAPAAAQLSEPFPAEFDVESLASSQGGDGSLGFFLTGDPDPHAVASGDVNGDGLADLIVGASWASSGVHSAGAVYVLFGRAGFAPEIDASMLDGVNGLRINGATLLDSAGASVASVDVNGDGVSDVVLGAPNVTVDGRSKVGVTYVIFGRAGGGFPAEIDVADLNGINGFRVVGVNAGDNSGTSVASAGDVNGDGVEDIIIGAHNAQPAGAPANAGASYVVFGSRSGFPPSIELGNLDGSNGFILPGIIRYGSSGRSVSSAGDVNGDGIDDIIIGEPAWEPGPYGRYYQDGTSYVVFGRREFPASFDLRLLDGQNGFRIKGFADMAAGFAVGSAGDFNNDGVDDIIIGAPWADYLYTEVKAFVVFGRTTGFPASIELDSIPQGGGVRFIGGRGGLAGFSVASVGDLNGDGIDDVAITDRQAYKPGPGEFTTGASYVVFGTADPVTAPIVLPELDGVNGFRIRGASSDLSAADVNGDGASDLLIGRHAWPSGEGRAYVVFGRTPDAACYADCDGNGELDFFDFLCFQNLFVAGDPQADCDGNGEIDFFDFLCFQNEFAAGCP